MQIDDLRREEVFLAVEMMGERGLGGGHFFEQGLNAEIAVAVLRQHGQPDIQQALFGAVCHLFDPASWSAKSFRPTSLLLPEV
ncbi:hypothetical protein [Aquisalimonas sp.]|uniref:hypothetical protein n=1 Tax=Aquisalimonas sp. TaxID=1872621 RepID=UPI0025C645AA|nr:hypothetical protein [Aquisalimonas sp.]